MVLKLEAYILGIKDHADRLLLLEKYTLEQVCRLLGKDK
jgi:hypothetical protein